MKKAIAVVPARMDSSRFPGKPLIDLLGLPMVIHCAMRARLCEDIDKVLIATCDREIEEVAREFGFDCVMTSADHQRASDRVAEVSAGLKNQGLVALNDTILLLQGDEPLVTRNMMSTAIRAFQSESHSAVNLAGRIETLDEFLSPNTIKVAIGSNRCAQYMSRAPIPYKQGCGVLEHLVAARKQVCVIPFSVQSLADYSSMPVSPLEELEQIDMLRFLENGSSVLMVETDERSLAIDVPDDVAEVCAKLLHDETWQLYSRK